MDKLDNKLNKFFSSLQFLSPWLIRLALGIAFSIHGLSKFPLIIFTLFFLLVSLLKTDKALDKLYAAKKFLINEINLFFLENSKYRFQKI